MRPRQSPPILRTLLLLAVILRFLLPAGGAWGADGEPDYLFRVQMDGMVLSEDVGAYERGEETLLPLCELSSLTSLAIRMEGEERAVGFILDESRSFALDLNNGTVTVAGKRSRFDPQRVIARGREIYVAARLLSEWLPMDLRVSREEQVVTVVAREQLPMQGMMQRKALPRATPVAANLNSDNGFPESTPEYRFLGAPFADFSVLVDTAGDSLSGSKKGEVRYSLLTNGDLAWMTGTLFASASNDRLDRLDLSFGRVSPDGALLGPLRASAYRIGAVQLPAMKGASRVTSPLYGFLVTNRSPSASSRFATHDILGQLPMGWDAELYYNGVPVGYLPPSDDGTYRFDSLPLQYGPNDFRVVLHGPHGEVRESRQRFLLDGLMVEPGKVVYTCGINRGVVAEPKKRTGLLTMDIGLTKRLSAFAGIAATGREEEEERGFLGLGLRGTLGSSFSSLDYVRSKDGGNALFLTLSSHAVPGVYLFLDQAILRRFESEVFPSEANPLVSLTQLRLEGSLPLETRLPYSVEGFLARRQNGDLAPGGSLRVTGGVAGVSVTTQLAARYENRQTDVTGLVLVGTALRDFSIRGQAAWSIVPSARIEAVQLAGSKEMGRGYQMIGAVNHEPKHGAYGVTAGLSKRAGSFSFTLSAGWDSPGSYRASAQLSFGLGMDPVTARPLLDASPVAASGAARAVAFVDRNGNGRRNDGEPVLKDVRFSLDGAVLPDRTGDDGTIIIRQLQPGSPVELAVVAESATDPFLSPAVRGHRFTPRPGVMGVFDLPFVPSGEIDGVVKAAGSHGDVPLAGVYLVLTDAGGRETGATRSDQSGYYLFKGVRAGNYRVALRKGEDGRLGVRQESPPEVEMPAGGDLVGGVDVVLSLPDKPKS